MKRRQIVALVGVLTVLTGVGGSMYHMSGKEEICRVDADKRILINPEKHLHFITENLKDGVPVFAGGLIV